MLLSGKAKEMQKLRMIKGEDEKREHEKREHEKREDALRQVQIRKQRIVILIGCLMCLLVLFCRFPRQAEVTVLDVGQGDGIYIHTSDGADVFIDGGSTDVKQAGKYRILPFLKSQGAAGIDYWFVSHLDQDHISGLEEIIESSCDIGQVIFAEGVVRDEAFLGLTQKLKKKHIAIRYLKKGDVLRGRNARFCSLAPDEREAVDDRNAASLVLLYEDSGFRAFFPGDISAKEEQKLAAEKTLPSVSLYKAAHHGSNYSNSEELLAQLRPQISTVSCAEKNEYGHPGKDAAANMEAHSGNVYYTMQAGQVRIRWTGDKVEGDPYIRP